MKRDVALGGVQGVGATRGGVAPVPDVAVGDGGVGGHVLATGCEALSHACCSAVVWGGEDAQSGVDLQRGNTRHKLVGISTAICDML